MAWYAVAELIRIEETGDGEVQGRRVNSLSCKSPRSRTLQDKPQPSLEEE